jgi:hypothetical protein
MQFQEEMEALLERHVLNGLIDAPWVRTDDPESDDGSGRADNASAVLQFQQAKLRPNCVASASNSCLNFWYETKLGRRFPQAANSIPETSRRSRD